MAQLPSLNVASDDRDSLEFCRTGSHRALRPAHSGSGRLCCWPGGEPLRHSVDGLGQGRLLLGEEVDVLQGGLTVKFNRNALELVQRRNICGYKGGNDLNIVSLCTYGLSKYLWDKWDASRVHGYKIYPARLNV